MSIKKNYIYSVAYEILIMLLPLVTTPYISRVFGSEGTGIYSYTFSIATYFIMFARLGINNYGNRSIAKIRDNREKLNEVFTSLYCLQVILGILAFITYIIYAINFSSDNKVIALLQAIYIFSAIFDINWLFFGLEKFKITVIRNSIIKIITVLLILSLVKNADDLWIYTIIMCMGNLVSELIIWRYVKKYVSFVKINFNKVITHIKPMIILFIPILSLSVFKTMDKIMLGKFCDMRQVGLYQNSQQLLGFPQGIITALGTVMLPKMCNLIEKGDKKVGYKYIGNSIFFTVALASAISFGIAGIAPQLIPIFLGNDFIECINYVLYLSPTVIFISWSYAIRSQYLIPMGLDIVYIKATIFAAIINFTLNIILLKSIGAIGVIIATLIAELFLAIYQSYKVKNELDILKHLKKGGVFILIGALMFCIVRFIGNVMEDSIITIFMQILIGGIVYCSLSLIYIYIKERELLLKLLKNNKLKK